MKKLFSILLAVAMTFVCTLPASALTNYKLENYKANYRESEGDLPTADEENPNAIIIKGKAGTGNFEGMNVGPYIPVNATLKQGETHKEVLYIDHSTLKTAELFQLSYQIFNDGEYANELDTFTQLGYDGIIRVSICGVDDFELELPDNGIYKYEFFTYVDEGTDRVTVGFTVYKADGTLVGGIGGLDLNADFITKDTKEVKGSNATLNAIWFCNIKVEDGLRVYHLTDAEAVVDNSDITEDADHVSDVLAEALADSDYRFKEVTVGVEMNTEEVDEEESKAIEEEAVSLLENATIASYFDLTVAVRDGEDNVVGTLGNLPETITLKVNIPEDIAPVKDGYTRTYYVLRNHGGKVEVLDTILTEDGKTLSFESDLFSTYALAYEDVENAGATPENPDTNDNITSFMAMGIASLLVVTGGIVLAKKKELF